MSSRTSLIRISTLVTLIGFALAGAHASAQDDAVMTVDAGAPLQATLMPTVSVVADATRPDAEARWSVADTRPLRVTLMPTVRVTAQVETLAVTTLPTVRIHAKAHAPAAIALDGTSLPPVHALAARQPVANPDAPGTLVESLHGPDLLVVPR